MIHIETTTHTKDDHTQVRSPMFISSPLQHKEEEIRFDAIRLKLASPDDILAWSYGEVSKAETINYRTQKPEKEGLFDERIFGPTKDWECYCGKYKRIRYKGIICDKCGVEVTRAIVRRERMGHINLAAPVSHIWFLRGIPSKISLVLNLSVQELEKVIYFANFIIIKVDDGLKKATVEQLRQEYKTKSKTLENDDALPAVLKEEKKKNLEAAFDSALKELQELKIQKIISEHAFQDLSLKYGHIFEASIGAEAIRFLLEHFELKKEIEKLDELAIGANDTVKARKDVRRLKLLKTLLHNGIRPDSMILTILPVIPPDLRPMVQLDGGRFATSDLNDLYRRVINRNNRLKKLVELNAPEVISRNEKRMLQEAVDALLDNSARHGKTITASTGQKRQLKSLADMLKGKQGRFRQNLLGKRIDYSGRSVIVVGPKLGLHQCGLPKTLALELFRPFVISQLLKRELAHNVRSANRYIESGKIEIWDILEEITSKTHVLLNRAPTLHRLGIQAFQPVLIEGKAIQVHPLVCTAFNADFDGDQMAVHVPLTEEAKWEAKEIMLSAKNLLKPATGEPVVAPSKDIILGIYYLTSIETKEVHPKAFSSGEEAKLAYEFKHITLRQPIKVLHKDEMIETTVGRVIFNEQVPHNFPYVNTLMGKKEVNKLIAQIFEKEGTEATVAFMDTLMALAFKYVTQSGISWGMNDLPPVPGKRELIVAADEEIKTTQEQYETGLLTEDERHTKIVETWARVKEEVTSMVKKTLSQYSDNPAYFMIDSGARGSWGQVTQMMGMKGLVTNPAGDTIELPVKASFKEGFDVLEFFVSTHGARKGLTDTALRTANAGYLTRRLIDVAQDIVINEEDCHTEEGITITKKESEAMGETIASRAWGRVPLEDIKEKGARKVSIKKGTLITNAFLPLLVKADLDSLVLRSTLTCESEQGVCQKCYGYDLGYNKEVALGTAVGIIAAQSIGEPGTQLTMRTFHTGGVAGQDIVQGLPSVEEIFENRISKKGAVLSDIAGTIEILDADKQQKTIRVSHGEGESKEVRDYIVPPGFGMYVKNGELVGPGDQLTEGNVNLQSLFTLKGKMDAQKYIVKEIQSIYASQGQKLNDKHVEIIARQMFSRVYIKDAGDTDFLPGDTVEHIQVVAANKEMKLRNGAPAIYDILLLGITKASLSTSSFLSAASFQETAKVLIDAAITGKVDKLRGLKENVIIGRLIPAGTGIRGVPLSVNHTDQPHAHYTEPSPERV